MKKIPADKSWTLFLDRDGVLNRKIENGYVTRPEEMEILPGVPEALKFCSNVFGKMIIVTNQRGIGRGLMTERDFKNVMRHFLKEINRAGGRIDAVYHCPHVVEDRCDCRKPKTGMALQAKAQFPEIDLSKAVMVGDSSSDIRMGKHLGIVTVGIGNVWEEFDPQPDFLFDSLKEMADNL